MKEKQLNKTELELLQNWAEVELETIDEMGFANKDHFESYKQEVKQIKDKLNDLIKEKEE